jgi:serine O-acetyltransferase
MTPDELVNGLGLAAYSPLKFDCLMAYAYTRGPRWQRLLSCARTPGLHAMVVHRFGQWIPAQAFWVRLLLEPLYLLLFHRIRTKWGIGIGRSAQIGPGCYIGHFGGIIVSGGARIGSNCNLSHGVTIGVSGYGEKYGAPIIGHDVSIAPGAKLFGRIRVGHNVKIGANAVICEDIPDHAVVALTPGYTILSYKGNRIRTATDAESI